MAIQGPDNTPKPLEIHILSKTDLSDEQNHISLNSILDDLKVSKEESIRLGLNREYDLTNEEDIEAFQKDMHFDENNLSIHEMLKTIKQRKEQMKNGEENIGFGLNHDLQPKTDLESVLKDKKKLSPKLSVLAYLFNKNEISEDTLISDIKSALGNFEKVEVTTTRSGPIEVVIDGKTSIIINSGIINQDYSVEYHNEDGSVEKYDKEGNKVDNKKEYNKPRMSYNELLNLLKSQPEQLAMNTMSDGGSTSCTIHTPEGDMIISINNSLSDRKHNGYITVRYPDGLIQTISPNNTVVNPREENEADDWFSRLNLKHDDLDILK